MNKLYISGLESIYLFYMFHFFETTTDFNVLASPKGWWFEHLIGNQKGLRICPFGRIAIFVFIFIIIIRNYIEISQFFMNIVFLITFLLSLMNLNAVVYILPILILEYINEY